MTLKAKLNIFIFIFFAVTFVFIAGSFMVFDHLSGSYESIRLSMQAHALHDGLDASIKDFLKTAKGWAITGEAGYKGMYRDKMRAVYKQFENIETTAPERISINDIKREFEEIKSITNRLMAVDSPIGDMDVLFELRRLEVKESDMYKRLDNLHMEFVGGVSSVVEGGRTIKREVALYLTALLVLSSLAFLFLAFFIKRVIAVPFNDILTATEKIISGDLGYRIATKRKDEFGIIADRFDSMVEELQQISDKNEELYLSARNQVQKLRTMHELAKAITSTVKLEDLLRKIAEEATRLLSAKGCVIRLLEDKNLIIRASFGLPREVEKMMTLALGEGLPGKVALEGRPILVEDLSKMPSEWKIPYLDARSVLNMPLMVGNKVIGTIGFYDKMVSVNEIIPFTGDDVNTAEGFASLSAIAIEKAKMFELEIRREQEAVEAKKRLDVLFDSVQGGIITLARDYTILSVNRYVTAWMDNENQNITGKDAVAIFHDRRGICPHCVAQATFETGEINTITQMSGLNYAELTSYPIKDDAGSVTECVVFIQDITDRVLYQEEMLALYREVAQTKERLESLIENSADAIVTSDLNGIVTSWNSGAERIYGLSAEESVNKFLPFVPDNLKEAEKELTERVKDGEILKDIETIRQRKDGAVIEVSLTLSPIKDASGGITGISGISRDISEKKRVEKDLVRRNQELSRLFFISSAMRSTLDLNRLLRMTLTAVTMGDGLGFNRAVLFLFDEDKNVLKGAMGVGPASYEEAGKIWEKLSVEKKALTDVIQEIEFDAGGTDSFLDRLSAGIEIPLDRECIFAAAVREKKPFNVVDARNDPRSDAVLIQQLGTEAYAVVPLISRDRAIGALWVDNLFNKRRITEEDMKFLTAFSNNVAAAIESAKLFEKVSFAEAELENIFRSISDMVYFTDMDYTIKSINKAVKDRFGLDEKELVGKKCYEIFHGMNEPPTTCPHHKTVKNKKAYIEEFEDRHLGGTFLTSTSPIFDISNNFVGTVHIVRDITELKQIRERLASAERMAALGEVAAKVAHEIRNPLVSIGGFAQRLEKKLEGNLKEYAVIIAREVKRLEDILKDILGFVREARFSLANVNLNDLLKNVMSLSVSEINERGITIEADYADMLEVRVDPDRIVEALLNIINNAIQAVISHGKIIVRTYEAGGYAVVEVRDTGEGIAEKDLHYIFDPFYTTKPYGTGLGLAITRRIVEEHGGKIEVASVLGEGTSVRVFLPIKKEEGR